MKIMDLCNKQTLKLLLRKYQIRPRKHWGQNFLVSRAVLKKILDAADIKPTDTVLEIGGGIGTLTVELAKRAKRVMVYEYDPKLCELLREILIPFPNVELHCTDARRIDASSLPTEPYILVANLPYSVGTVILRQLLESERPPRASYSMLQREVAERITAKPPHMSLLGVAFQMIAEPQILFRVPKRAFWPEPEVESALLRLSPHQAVRGLSLHSLIVVAKQGFAHPRKYVLSNLTRNAAVRDELKKHCAIPERARPQELTLNQWQCVAETMEKR